MRNWLETDWGKLFIPEMSLPELLIRATLIYISLCLMLRVVLKRQVGRIALSDLLVVSLVAGVSQSADSRRVLHYLGACCLQQSSVDRLPF